MENIVIFSKLAKLYLKKLIKLDSNANIIIFSSRTKQDLLDFDKKMEKEIIPIGNEFQIDFNYFDFKIYENKRYFFKRNKLKVKFDKDIAIFSYEKDTPIFWDQLKKIANNLDSEVNDDFFFHNYLLYSAFVQLFKDKEQDESNFVDYYNHDSKEIIFTSPSEHGKLIVGWNNSPEFSHNISYTYDVFAKSFENHNQDFHKFLKNQLFKYLQNTEKSNRLKTFIDKFELIFESAEREYDAFILNLSTDQFRDEFIDKKTAIYEKYSNILSKTTANIASLPISVSAASFAAYKMQEFTLTLVCILTAYILYAWYSYTILNMFEDITKDLREDFKKDFNDISNHKYFKKHISDVDFFKKNTTDLKSKITNIRLLIIRVKCIALTISLLFSSYIVFQIIDNIFKLSSIYNFFCR